jgi:dTDP-4-amino-4,6-dideoxy-D-galactose acyltransferase
MTQAHSQASLETLEWDSNFFSVSIARVGLKNPSLDQLSDAVEEANRREVDCLYWLADSDDPLVARAASRTGFRLVDVRVTLERSLGDTQEARDASLPTVRLFRAEDASKLLDIAARSHRDSRFFHDGNFAEDKCAALYQEWVRKACRSRSDAVLVAEVYGQPAGYCVVRTGQNGEGSISLIAVDSRYRRARAGTALVQAALDHSRKSGASVATVVTQARNVASQRLYQRCGFITRSVELWYHRWRSEVS